MQTHSRAVSFEGYMVDLHASPDECARRLDGYLAKSKQKLDEIADRVSWGEVVDYETHSWMLDQVDFLVDTIGDERLQLSDEMRSNLLQFLLAIANLNEEIRHKSALGL